MKNKIVWEKWSDPLSDETKDDSDDWSKFEGDDYDDDDDDMPDFPVGKSMKVLQTPFGMMQIDNSSLLSSNIDFWIMHTNFDIIPDVANIINKVPGVETLEIFTRYRARIGIPKSGLFDAVKVRKSIETIIKQYYINEIENALSAFDDIELKEKLLDIKSGLDTKYDNWTVLVLPNGCTEVVVASEQDEEYIKQQEVLYQTLEAVSGHILTSDGDIA